MEEHKGPAPVQIPAAAWKAKYQSKREQFDFLTICCKAWLSSYETVTMYFLKDFFAGKKKCKDVMKCLTSFSVIKCDQVKIIFVPQYESLSLERVLKKAREWPEVW